MELKFWKPSQSFLCAEVSIVPLWNWNIVLGHILWLKREFQSYLYGIEIILLLWVLQVRSLFQSYLYGIEIACFISCSVGASVSIVPLWNWNKLTVWIPAYSVVFQSYLYGIEMQANIANRNLQNGFNRTFMELKCEIADKSLYLIYVSIVPLWNWNLCVQTFYRVI